MNEQLCGIQGVALGLSSGGLARPPGAGLKVTIVTCKVMRSWPRHMLGVLPTVSVIRSCDFRILALRRRDRNARPA